MSGLLAALELRRAGWDADVYERVDSELSGRGAGIVAQPDLIERIRRLGIDATDLGVAITSRKILDAGGRLVCERECPQVLAAWERVYRVLRDAFPPAHYHRGRGVVRFSETGRSVVAHFADGGTRRGRPAGGGRRHPLDHRASNACRRWRRNTPATRPGARSFPRRRSRPTSTANCSST